MVPENVLSVVDCFSLHVLRLSCSRVRCFGSFLFSVSVFRYNDTLSNVNGLVLFWFKVTYRDSIHVLSGH